MGEYQLDVHVHTAEVSSCGFIKAVDVVSLYKNNGYDGVVITDHFYRGYFASLNGLTTDQKIECFLSGYRIARTAGQLIGLDVFLGIELRFTDSDNDYLVYGVSETFLKHNPRIYNLNLQSFRQLIQGTEMLIYQAHPFRPGIYPADPELLDGVEVVNGNKRHDSQNHLAHSFANTNGLRMISGSDFHQTEDLARGGIIVPERIATGEELCRMLREDRELKLIGV